MIRLAVRTTHRGLPLRRIAAPDLVLVGDAGLVAPVDHRARSLGALRDRRTIPLQPSRDRRRLALPGASQRLLRRHAPALQIELHGRQTERLVVPQRDQVAHRTAGPKREGQLQLVWRLVHDPAPNLERLVGRQQPLDPTRRHAPTIEQTRLARRPIAPDPDVHRLPLHPDHPSRRGLAQPLMLDQHQRPTAQCLLRRPANTSKVPRFRAQSIADRQLFVRYIAGILVR